jgi:hypothetical protein
MQEDRPQNKKKTFSNNYKKRSAVASLVGKRAMLAD